MGTLKFYINEEGKSIGISDDKHHFFDNDKIITTEEYLYLCREMIDNLNLDFLTDLQKNNVSEIYKKTVETLTLKDVNYIENLLSVNAYEEESTNQIVKK